MQKIKSNIFINLLTLFISSFICLLLVEILLNKHFDNRTIEEFIFDQKNNNILSFPVISPDLHIYNDGIDSTYPLSGLSSVNTVFCKTNSDWVTYFSDSYGFNNKNENLQKIEALLIGDSFTQGVCVDSNSNISSHLSNLGYNTINKASIFCRFNYNK